MDILRFDLSKTFGGFKVLNATNGGPWHRRKAIDQLSSNFNDYKEARFRYSRNHDSGVNGVYGGPYSHDISKIFRNFDADENDPASYDFACTDEAIIVSLEADTQTFFRLGETIEHQVKKHATLPPKDFHKWARICEKIIRHYNEGWADGFEFGIEYWEIWNEPDLDGDDAENKRTWGGTKEQFFDMYEIAAKHLKGCFPHLKIGGPALAWNEEWAAEFLEEMKKRGVEIDFFSWHAYHREPVHIIDKAHRIKGLLRKYGYGNAESILNEWNYIKNWTDMFKYSIKSIHGLKGSSFVMASICEAQKSAGIDMLMYYDTRPSSFCGVFDFYTEEPLKGYYPFMWYGKFYDLEAEVRCEYQPERVYTLCGVDKDGKAMCVVTNYSDDDDAPAKDIEVDFGRSGRYELYLLDKDNDGTLIKETDELKFRLELHSSILIKEI